MRILLSTFLASLICTGLAHAEPNPAHIVDAQLVFDSAFARIQLVGSEPLGRPTVGTRKGSFRVWIPGQADRLRFELTGDGRALRNVRIRPGDKDSAVVLVKLGDRRKLKRADIQIKRSAERAEILIPLDKLPSLTPEPPKVATPRTTPQLIRKPAPVIGKGEGHSEIKGASTGPVETVSSPTSVEAEKPPKASEGDEDVVIDQDDATQDAQASSAGLPFKEAGSVESDEAALPKINMAQTGGLDMLAMWLICGVLVLALAALKWLQRRRSGTSKPVIQVVAARKLGPGHQLVVVRAFGKDHLLSINGKTTERIASETAPGMEPSLATPDPEELPLPGLDLGRKGSLLSRIMPPERPPAFEDDVPLREDTAPSPRFGEALMKMAQGTQEQRPAPRATHNSDAIAGLLKLKERTKDLGHAQAVS